MLDLDTLMEKCIILRGTQRKGHSSTHCWHCLRKGATRSYFLLHALFLRGKKVALINPSCSFCIYTEKKILIFPYGPGRHSEITSYPVWVQPTLSLLGSVKPTALLSHLVSFLLKSPSCPSETEWITTITNI